MRPVPNRRFAARSLLAVCLALPALAVLGCSRRSGSNETANAGVLSAPPSLLVVAIDRSGSTDAMRADQLDTLDLLTKIALAGDRRMFVWAFDHRPLCIWGPRVPGGPDDLQQVKARELAPDPKANRCITRPALLLKALADDPDFRRAGAADIVILTDGDAEDANDRVTFVRTAREMGKNPHLRMCIVGIRSEARSEWEKSFSGEWGSRFMVAGPSEARAAIHQFLP